MGAEIAVIEMLSDELALIEERLRHWGHRFLLLHGLLRHVYVSHLGTLPAQAWGARGGAAAGGGGTGGGRAWLAGRGRPDTGHAARGARRWRGRLRSGRRAGSPVSSGFREGSRSRTRCLSDRDLPNRFRWMWLARGKRGVRIVDLKPRQRLHGPRSSTTPLTDPGSGSTTLHSEWPSNCMISLVCARIERAGRVRLQVKQTRALYRRGWPLPVSGGSMGDVCRDARIHARSADASAVALCVRFADTAGCMAYRY
jgi:hypothetical protein